MPASSNSPTTAAIMPMITFRVRGLAGDVSAVEEALAVAAVVDVGVAVVVTVVAIGAMLAVGAPSVQLDWQPFDTKQLIAVRRGVDQKGQLERTIRLKYRNTR